MALLIRYVDIASDGGDGTTQLLTGASSAFKHLADAFNACPSWPSLLGNEYKFIVRKSVNLPDTVECTQSVMDQVTSAVDRITVTVDESARHHGVPDTTKYYISLTDKSAFYNNYGSHITLEWLQVQIKVTTSTGANYNCYRLCTANNQSANIDHKIHHCLGWRDPTSTGTDKVIGTVNSDPTGGGFNGDCRVSWCGFFNGCYAGVNSDGGDANTGWAANHYYVENCTCVGNMINYLDIMRVRNCLGLSNTFAGDFLSVGTKGCSNNVSGDASAPGANSLINQEGLVQFVNPAGLDFHLQQTDTVAAGHGLSNPGAEVAPKDIDNENLVDPWPVGFDQWHAIVLPLPPPNGADFDDDWWPMEHIPHRHRRS